MLDKLRKEAYTWRVRNGKQAGGQYREYEMEQVQVDRTERRFEYLPTRYLRLAEQVAAEYSR
jgi:hypothetical protein